MESAKKTPGSLQRCPWPGDDPEYILYHDREWGLPLHDDQKLFELLILEGFQAGLSWLTILKRRSGFREVFEGFDLHHVAAFGLEKQKKIARDPRIIRNKMKVEAAVKNARAALAVQGEFGSLSSYLWQFTGGKTILNHWETMSQVPAFTPESTAMSRDMKKRGFSFVGPTICYAFMQSAGMVNDHLTTCFRHKELAP